MRSILRSADHALCDGKRDSLEVLHNWVVSEMVTVEPDQLQVNAFDLAEYLDLLIDELGSASGQIGGGRHLHHYRAGLSLERSESVPPASGLKA